MSGHSFPPNAWIATASCMRQDLGRCILQMESSAESLSTAIANEQKKRAMLEQERDQLEEDGNTATARARELAEKLSHQELAAQRELANADRADASVTRTRCRGKCEHAHCG